MAHKKLKIKVLRGILLSLFFILLLYQTTYAQSPYVLPYPSSMPGNILYKINLVKERIMQYWYFGDFGQFDYNLMMSDKYLVEAKTLFDYRQYLLGYKALLKSDAYYKKIGAILASAVKHNKSTSLKLGVFKEAANKHIEELEKMEKNVPDFFEWRPEKTGSTTLKLKGAILNSIAIRSVKI